MIPELARPIRAAAASTIPPKHIPETSEKICGVGEEEDGAAWTGVVVMVLAVVVVVVVVVGGGA